MGNPFQLIDKLKTNIFGSSGGGSTTSIARQSTIEMGDTSPTARLKKDPMAFSSLAYPKNLINDVTNGHYMLFYINVQNKHSFPYTRADNGLSFGGSVTKMNPSDTTQKNGSNTQVKTENIDIETTTNGGAIQDSHPFLMTQAKRTNQAINSSDVKTIRKQKMKMRTGLAKSHNPTIRITDSIAIYLPPNVQDNYSTKYSGAETAIMGFIAASGGAFLEAYRNNDFIQTAEILKDTAGGLFGQLGIRAGTALADLVTGSEGGFELANKIFGQTTNPYMEVLFNGVDLRTFTYNFTFAPRNEFEQAEVKKIIHLFRFHQAPELRSNESIFMGLPSEFDIYYMYQHEDGKVVGTGENLFYNQISTCVLTNVTVDYTPGAVNSHADGSPVQIKMTLSFLETEMITKDHVEAGY